MTSENPAPSQFITAPKDLAVVAASSGIGQMRDGVETTPQVLMSGRLPNLLRRSLGMTLYGDTRRDDCGPLHNKRDYMNNPIARADHVADITKRVSRWVYDHAMAGRMVLTLGGDHSIAIGSVSGSARAINEKFTGQKRLGVIWVDAHADINTPATSGSGNIHGMPLAFLSGLAPPTSSGAFSWIKDEHKISLDRLVYIALREIDDAELKVIRDHNIKVFRPFDLTDLGMKGVMDEVFNYLGHDTPLHLSFDINSLDPSVAPSTALPVQGGLTLRESLYISERLSRSGQLVSIDLVELNPELGTQLDRVKTLDVAVAIIFHALGGTVV